MTRHPTIGQVATSYGGPDSGPGLAPASAYGQMAEQILSEDVDHVTNIVTHPWQTITETASRTVAMERQVLQEALDPFTQAPSSAAAAPGHYFSAALGLVGLVEQFQYVGIASLTAPYAALIPPLPCATLMMPMLGIPHAHTHPPSFIAPAPPIPLPSLGIMTVPGAISVLVGGVPAARCGDVGLILTCGTFGVPCEVMLGSSNTFFGGSRAARMGPDLFFHDNPGEMGAAAMMMAGAGAVAAQLTAVGQVAEGNFGGAMVTMAQQAADAAALALKMMRRVDPGAPPDAGVIMLGDFTVLVGGAPFPAAMDLATVVGKLRGLAARIRNRGRNASGDASDGPRHCGSENCG